MNGNFHLSKISLFIIGKCVRVSVCVSVCVSACLCVCVFMRVSVGACKCQYKYVTFDWWVQKLQYFVLITLQRDNSKNCQLSTKYRVTLNNFWYTLFI